QNVTAPSADLNMSGLSLPNRVARLISAIGRSSLMPLLESSEAAARALVTRSGRQRRSPLAGPPATSSIPAGLHAQGGYRAPRRAPGAAGRPSRTRTR